jgi:hypothetical protein
VSVTHLKVTKPVTEDGYVIGHDLLAVIRDTLAQRNGRTVGFVLCVCEHDDKFERVSKDDEFSGTRLRLPGEFMTMAADIGVYLSDLYLVRT